MKYMYTYSGDTYFILQWNLFKVATKEQNLTLQYYGQVAAKFSMAVIRKAHFNQGWHKTRVLPYCPAQRVILGKPGFYWVLLGNTGYYWAI